MPHEEMVTSRDCHGRGTFTNTNASNVIDLRQALKIEAAAIRALNASVVQPTTDIGAFAIEYALHGWPVFPLRGKVPAISKARGGRGVLDAAIDVDQIAEWWGGAYVGSNIGGRVPGGMVVVDVDPRHGGADSLAVLERAHGPLPSTLVDLSGREDGGAHYFFRRPAGRLTDRRLGSGIDVKTDTGYVVLPPSIHPDTHRRYRRIEAPVAAPPDWLIELLTVPPLPRTPQKYYNQHNSGIPTPAPSGGTEYFTGSVADHYTATTSWAEILEPHGWVCLDADPDADGSRWRHPNATAAYSASVKFGLLFVFSPNTPFVTTESGNAHGYRRFRAYAVLNHGGDLSTAACELGKAVH